MTPLGARGDVQPVSSGVGDVEVEAQFLLPYMAGVEFGRALQAERGVDRIPQEKIGLMGAVAGAEVPNEAGGRESTQTGDH